MTLLFYIIIDIVAVILLFLAEKYSHRAGNNNSMQCLNPKWSLYKLSVTQYFAFCSFLVLFLTAALRDGVGRDYSGYAQAFIRVNNGTMSSIDQTWLSTGYILLCRVVGFIDKDSHILMFAVVSAFTLFFLYKAIMKFGDTWTFSLYLFLCFCLYYQTFNQMRQMMALTIGLFALVYLKQNKKLKYALCILLAASIHASAIVLLILLVVGKWKWSFKNICIYLMGAVIAYVGFNAILWVISYTGYGQIYLNWTKYNTSFEETTFINLAIRIMLLLVCGYFAKETIQRVPHAVYLYNAAIICTILQLLSLKLDMIGRVTTYFYVPYIFLIPEVIKTVEYKFTRSSRGIVVAAAIVLFALYHFVYYFSGSGAVGSGYDVYKSLVF